MTQTCNVVVLISGNGSNLQALLDSQTPEHPLRISAVISNRADAYGLERAAQANVPTQVLNHKDFSSREDFDAALIQLIDQYQPHLVVLAGFMRILSAGFVEHYQGRLLNIHPSLLPKYKGLETHRRALEAGEPEHGCSVHFVSAELDGGPVIAQARLRVWPNESVDTLAHRVHELEHQIYPMVTRWFAEGRLRLATQGAMLDGKLLPTNGYVLNT
ncbi:phosphoribosylglycinamide formyltransferase-1 [Azomonas agilis]|uniref:Phosphoribosylglycinamide formyltransferase n=1 Tax=Azomonas agilis TaxID=116849 RepID=A0A562I240_9GAMM|nr:phosphoribosylglycinamide formyltransferase [Azomonas agilis]TWH64745.1 phosphoribosylglycinamide formyltransferase-1 [Azomonas agilis]